MNLKKLFLDKSNAKKFAIENDAIRNLFDSITNFRVQSSEKFRIFLSIEIQKTFDEMLKNRRISNETSMKFALLKHSIKIVSKSSKKSFNMIIVVKEALRKQNASQNTRSVKRIMRREKSFLNTTFWNVDESSLFRFKNTIVDYENLESRDVIWDVFKQDLIFKASLLKLQNVFKILQETDSFVVRIRLLVQKTSMKQRKNEDDRENFESTLSKIRKTIDSISNQNELWRMKFYVEITNDIFLSNCWNKNCWNKIMMISSSNILNSSARFISWNENTSKQTWSKTWNSTLTIVQHVIAWNQFVINRMICCSRYFSRKIQDRIESWISS